jgi:hypothetical protein
MIETDATLTVMGVSIPGRLTRAEGRARAAVLLLPGSLYADVDGNYPMWNARPHTNRDIAEQLAERGIAVLRQAKIGPGTGSQTIDAEAAKAHQHFRARVTVADEALKHLARQVPDTRLYVAGHSEGAVVASMLAGLSPCPLAGLISLSGPALRLFDIMRSQAAAMFPGADLSLLDECYAALRAGKPLPEAARTNPASQMLANMPPEALAYVRDIDSVDPCAAIAAAPQPALLVQGGRDQSVFPEQVDQLANARAGKPTQIARFPELQHMYKHAEPGLNAMQSFMLSTDSDPAVTKAISDWIG